MRIQIYIHFDNNFSTVKHPKKSNKHNNITFIFKSLDNKTNPSYSFNSGYISSTKAKNKTIYAQSPNIKFLFTYNLKLVKFAIVTVKSYIILT